MGKTTISMAIFNSYVSLPEGTSNFGLGSPGDTDHRRPRTAPPVAAPGVPPVPVP